mmetsp:Transcript_37924/g.118300  ORF Transcript_37924/g.118300 Transcript_37924/m.118300 type:complete len:202 (+) Transcript_37924:121-726(+)
MRRGQLHRLPVLWKPWVQVGLPHFAPRPQLLLQAANHLSENHVHGVGATEWPPELVDHLQRHDHGAAHGAEEDGLNAQDVAALPEHRRRAGAEKREGQQLRDAQDVEEDEVDGRQLPLHGRQALAPCLPEVPDGVVDDRGHAHRSHVEDVLQRVVHRAVGQQLCWLRVELPQVLGDVLPQTLQDFGVERPALAHEGRLLEE